MQMKFDNGPFNEDTDLQAFFIFLRSLGFNKVIETGTFKGTTTAFLATHFDQVTTFEVVKDYYDAAAVNLQSFKNIIMANMDSAAGLAKWLEHNKAESFVNTLFFLDAHWWTNPLLGELESIANSHAKNSILIIHDMQNPFRPEMGYDEYKEQNIVYNYQWLLPSIEKIYGKVGIDFYLAFNKKATGAQRGCLFVIPDCHWRKLKNSGDYLVYLSMNDSE